MKRLLFFVIAVITCSCPAIAQNYVKEEAPFTSPRSLILPSGMPSRSLPAGEYLIAPWLNMWGDRTNSYRADTYIGNIRKRGNIVSFYSIRRSLIRNDGQLNPKNYGSGIFLPQYVGSIRRYDCKNDRSMFEIIMSTSHARPGGTGFRDDRYDQGDYMSNESHPNQVRLIIEGRPYWVLGKTYNFHEEEKPAEWSYVLPGSYGASDLDYACTNF